MISITEFSASLLVSGTMKVRQTLMTNHLHGKKVAHLQLTQTGEGTGNSFYDQQLAESRLGWLVCWFLGIVVNRMRSFLVRDS